MNKLLLCCGVFGEARALEGLRDIAMKRRPDAILFSGGILSKERQFVSRCRSCLGLTSSDERFVHHFFAVLGGLCPFTAVIAGPNFEAPDDFYRMALAAEVEFPSVHVVDATLVEQHELAVCGLGMAITEQPLMREDACSRVRAQYLLRSLRGSDKPRKVLLLPEPPPGALGGAAGNEVVGDLIDSLAPSLCVVLGQTAQRGIQRTGKTLTVNPGCLVDGSAAWLNWDLSGDDRVEFLNLSLAADKSPAAAAFSAAHD